MSVPRERRADVPVSAIMTEPLRVPETMTLDNLLAELRGKGYQLAIVIDEYGGTAGITTLEDVVEELIGEVADEHDRTAAPDVARKMAERIPGALCHILPGAGHLLNIEQPDAFNTVLLQFLRQR
jgi:CBS domain containing-hemolysin-like protein